MKSQKVRKKKNKKIQEPITVKEKIQSSLLGSKRFRSSLFKNEDIYPKKQTKFENIDLSINPNKNLNKSKRKNIIFA